MHQCLRISEVLTMIFDSCDNESLQRIVKLYPLVLVCKTFAEPALDLLWGDPKAEVDLMDMLSCLPPNVWADVTSKERVFASGYSLSPYDLDRLRYYSWRIKSLSVSWNVLDAETPTRHVIGYGVLQAIHNCRNAMPGDGAICPKLRTLQWRGTEWSSLDYMGIFLGPNVTAVEVELGLVAESSTPARQAMALAQIHSLSPNLTSLILSDSCLDYDSTLPQELHALVLNLGRLESITCWSTPYIANGAVLYALACLPSLKSIGMLYIEDSALRGTELSSRPFCGLVAVNIMIESLGAAATFLGLMLASPLEELCIQTQNSHSLAAVLDFFSGLKRLENRLRLRCIDVACFDDELPEIGDDEPPRLDPLVLESLLEYTSLETVAIDLFLSMHDVDDDLLRRMAKAWPRLKVLALGKFHGCRWPSKVTVEGLRAFQRCPNLNRVELALDATMSQALAGWLCNPNLRTINALHSTISNPRLLATALMAMFPNLEHIEAWDGYDEDDEHETEQRRLWDECREFCELFMMLAKADWVRISRERE